MTDIDDILGSVELPETSVDLCLKASLLARFQELEAQLEMAREKSKTAALAGSPDVKDLAEQVEAVREEMRKNTTKFLFRALPKRAWQTLLDQHPARDGVDPADYNAETFPPAALAACAVEPKISAEKAGMLVDRLSAGQWASLWTAVVGLNIHEVDVPFSVTASAVLKSSHRN